MCVCVCVCICVCMCLYKQMWLGKKTGLREGLYVLIFAHGYGVDLI